ncbi:NADP oxidoreductase [Frondihabitans sp. PAMC 28766]|uniref:NADPH-dependent F420 reductase n=1 Tax=Frondihabitans sp. PAMC 28766 TaxID=1795630 RepID=UPI00078E950B|nr:NAD(P)-binding domain-containing protein [Frondihabitans sp. PAMC 28766]AMM21550.1 NADP oxidoreductase [Frondihabitans sp. PAMC 28766]
MSSISFIGLGGMTRAIATRALAAGHPVELVGRDAAKATDLAVTLGDGATTAPFGAAPAGDIVILAVPFTGAIDVVTQYGDALADKIVIDISNTFNEDASGVVTPDGTSGAQLIAHAAPSSTRIIKAFNTVFGHVLTSDRTLDVLFAGDDADAKATVSAFIESLGLRPFDVGGLAMARWLEAAGPLLMGLAQNGAGFDIALRVEQVA